jgi:hypothetical protein
MTTRRKQLLLAEGGITTTIQSAMENDSSHEKVKENGCADQENLV